MSNDDAGRRLGGGLAGSLERLAAETDTDPRAFFFTFGCGSPLARYYVLIEATDEMQARCRMVSMFSYHWAGVYPASELAGQIARYGLQRLDVYTQSSVRLGTNEAAVPLDIYNRAYPW